MLIERYFHKYKNIVGNEKHILKKWGIWSPYCLQYCQMLW